MDKLTRNEFKDLLKQADLQKKDLAVVLGTSYQAVNNWGTNDRDYPYWLKSWLVLYIKDKKCKKLRTLIKEFDSLD